VILDGLEYLPVVGSQRGDVPLAMAAERMSAGQGAADSVQSSRRQCRAVQA
jgi:hypothetical protein